MPCRNNRTLEAKREELSKFLNDRDWREAADGFLKEAGDTKTPEILLCTDTTVSLEDTSWNIGPVRILRN
jgi:hypothetical protein